MGTPIAGARSMIVPSRWYEGLPLVILCSLSFGTPLVVSDLENLCEDVVARESYLARYTPPDDVRRLETIYHESVEARQAE